VAGAVDHHNPRQREVWEMQSTHQSRLNHLHFKARLEGTSTTADASPIPTHEPIADETLGDDPTLIETLKHETRLLEDAKRNTSSEIDRCQKMLEDFREQRQKKLEMKRQEIEERRQLYDRELKALRLSIESQPSEINVSIRDVRYVRA
jgi:hypothetical protein